LLSARAGRGGL